MRRSKPKKGQYKKGKNINGGFNAAIGVSQRDTPMAAYATFLMDLVVDCTAKEFI